MDLNLNTLMQMISEIALSANCQSIMSSNDQQCQYHYHHGELIDISRTTTNEIYTSIGVFELNDNDINKWKDKLITRTINKTTLTKLGSQLAIRLHNQQLGFIQEVLMDSPITPTHGTYTYTFYGVNKQNKCITTSALITHNDNLHTMKDNTGHITLSTEKMIDILIDVWQEKLNETENTT